MRRWRSATDHRPAIEAAIRFFTRLGPFRFDAVHPTGTERVQRLMACLPPPQALGLTGPRAARPGWRPARSAASPAWSRSASAWPASASSSPAGMSSSGSTAGRWGVSRTGWRRQCVDLRNVSEGLHSYRVRMEVYSFDAMSQFERRDRWRGGAISRSRTATQFLVDWVPGRLPWLGARRAGDHSWRLLGLEGLTYPAGQLVRREWLGDEVMPTLRDLLLYRPRPGVSRHVDHPHRGA